MTTLSLIGLLNSVLFIITGLVLYVLYFKDRTNKAKKIYGKKFIIRGIVSIIVISITFFAVIIIDEIFSPQTWFGF